VFHRVSPENLHHLVGVPPTPEECRHGFHGPIDVSEESLVARAKIVETIFAVRRESEPVARAFAVASESNIAVATVARQRRELGVTKRALPFGVGEFWIARIASS
jgi:hypothetical protein